MIISLITKGFVMLTMVIACGLLSLMFIFVTFNFCSFLLILCTYLWFGLIHSMARSKYIEGKHAACRRVA